MKKAIQLETDTVKAVLYFLSHHVEIHYSCKNGSYIERGAHLLSYLGREGFIGPEPIKLIAVRSLNKQEKNNGK
jgi:hypothetical protein